MKNEKDNSAMREKLFSLVKVSFLKKSFVTAILVISVFAVFTAGASAAEIYVPEGGNQTIQQAVANASEYDTIIVRDAYTGMKENIDVNIAHLTIRSENGSANCIVNASNSGDHVFNVNVDYVNISGFTVENATGMAGIYLGTDVDHCNISDNNVTDNDYGIYLQSSSNYNTLTSNTASNNTGEGIYLDTSSNNTLTSNTASNNDWGICLYRSSNNTLTSNTANENTESGTFLWLSSNNTLTSNTANENTESGILLVDSSDNTFTSNNASNNKYGINLTSAKSSNNNTFTNDTASNNTDYDFYSDAASYNNTVTNLTISSYPTSISFTYDKGIGIKGVTTPNSDPSGKDNIGKFVNATNVTASSWLFLNVSYTDADVSSVEEDSLRLYRWNGTAWNNITGSNVNTAENYVYANVTSFSQIAPFGNPTPTPVPVPVFNTMGLLALIGILMVLAVATLRKRK